MQTANTERKIHRELLTSVCKFHGNRDKRAHIRILAGELEFTFKEKDVKRLYKLFVVFSSCLLTIFTFSVCSFPGKNCTIGNDYKKKNKLHNLCLHCESLTVEKKKRIHVKHFHILHQYNTSTVLFPIYMQLQTVQTFSDLPVNRHPASTEHPWLEEMQRSWQHFIFFFDEISKKKNKDYQ